jgi:hypothetical protein
MLVTCVAFGCVTDAPLSPVANAPAVKVLEDAGTPTNRVDSSIVDAEVVRIPIAPGCPIGLEMMPKVELVENFDSDFLRALPGWCRVDPLGWWTRQNSATDSVHGTTIGVSVPATLKPTNTWIERRIFVENALSCNVSIRYPKSDASGAAVIEFVDDVEPETHLVSFGLSPKDGLTELYVINGTPRGGMSTNAVGKPDTWQQLNVSFSRIKEEVSSKLGNVDGVRKNTGLFGTAIRVRLGFKYRDSDLVPYEMLYDDLDCRAQ